MRLSSLKRYDIQKFIEKLLSNSLITGMQVCRWVPWTIKNYKMEELTTADALRSNLSFMFREFAHVKDPKAVDILIYKGREELEVGYKQHRAIILTKLNDSGGNV